jgi:hypothetical protein
MPKISTSLPSTGDFTASYVDSSTEAQSGNGSEPVFIGRHRTASSVKRIQEIVMLITKSFLQIIQSSDSTPRILSQSASVVTDEFIGSRNDRT